ncbi:MAG: hypothetical protein S0880_03715 [Actinomycetota bacterium]|nr:hypothetical protein [Actinomycetota bacterium]
MHVSLLSLTPSSLNPSSAAQRPTTVLGALAPIVPSVDGPSAAVVALAVVWYAVGFAVALAARRRGHDRLTWLVGAALLGAALVPIALVAVVGRRLGRLPAPARVDADDGSAGAPAAPSGSSPGPVAVVAPHLRLLAAVSAPTHVAGLVDLVGRLGTRVDAPRLMAVLPVEVARGWLADHRPDALARVLDRLDQMLAPWRPTATLEEGDLVTRVRARARGADLVVVPADLGFGRDLHRPATVASALADVLTVPILVLPAVAAPARPTEAA